MKKLWQDEAWEEYILWQTEDGGDLYLVNGNMIPIVMAGQNQGGSGGADADGEQPGGQEESGGDGSEKSGGDGLEESGGDGAEKSDAGQNGSEGVQSG